MSWLARRFLTIPVAEVTFARRGFHAGDAQTCSWLEHIGRTFLTGYHAALEHDPEALGRGLDAVDRDVRGFAFEGAAMALTLLDALSPWSRNRRMTALLRGRGAAHVYMVHVGAGWALARLRRGARPPAHLDPLLGWLAVDGYGFHEGYFAWRHYVRACRPPVRVNGYERRVFDQGLGRSLWFVDGADPARIAAAVARFSPDRHSDLWSGVGLAGAYAGGATETALSALARAAGAYRACLAQGAAFAATARQRAGNSSPSTEAACRAFCAMSAAEAAQLVEAALQDLHAEGPVPAYEVWRSRIRRCFAVEAAAPPAGRSA
ncbi:MAG TPA: DUF1702 family protein [bacterium]|nr:DUF1702 family protein [bacterium]